MLTFSNISPAVFEAVLDELRQGSMVTEYVPGCFTIAGSGIEAIASLSNEVVYVQINSKPFYISESMIGSRIRNAIDAAQARIALEGGTA
jgi:uncharacterized protein (DUF1810 family)